MHASGLRSRIRGGARYLGAVQSARKRRDSRSGSALGLAQERRRHAAGATSRGWLSFFHGVDAIERDGRPALLYRAGIMVHDLERPHEIVYRSPQPVLGPVTPDERFGIVNDVVFPTGLDVRDDGTYDVYYGAADAKIALARFSIRLRR